MVGAMGWSGGMETARTARGGGCMHRGHQVRDAGQWFGGVPNLWSHTVLALGLGAVWLKRATSRMATKR
jgi:hypothetical protein